MLPLTMPVVNEPSYSSPNPSLTEMKQELTSNVKIGWCVGWPEQKKEKNYTLNLLNLVSI